MNAGDVEFHCTRFEPWLFGLWRAQIEARSHTWPARLLQVQPVFAHPDWNIAFLVTGAMEKVVANYMATARGLPA